MRRIEVHGRRDYTCECGKQKKKMPCTDFHPFENVKNTRRRVSVNTFDTLIQKLKPQQRLATLGILCMAGVVGKHREKNKAEVRTVSRSKHVLLTMALIPF